MIARTTCQRIIKSVIEIMGILLLFITVNVIGTRINYNIIILLVVTAISCILFSLRPRSRQVYSKVAQHELSPFS